MPRFDPRSPRHPIGPSLHVHNSPNRPSIPSKIRHTSFSPPPQHPTPASTSTLDKLTPHLDTVKVPMLLRRALSVSFSPAYPLAHRVPSSIPRAARTPRHAPPAPFLPRSMSSSLNKPNGTPHIPDCNYQPHRSDPSVPGSGPGIDWVSPILASQLEDVKRFRPPNAGKTHPPRILVLYGTLRERGFSKFLAFECARLLEGMGAEVRVFDPHGLPVRDPEIQEHPKVVELRSLVDWSEAHVWSASELHGNLCSVFKNQIDWIPLNTGSVRPTQGKCVAVLQVCGGSQSFNVVNTLRLLARWMRMLCVTNQSAVAMAWKEFDDDGRMKESSMRDRVVDVMEELMKTVRVNREYADFFTDRFSERKEREEKGRLLTQAEKEKEKEEARKKEKANE